MPHWHVKDSIIWVGRHRSPKYAQDTWAESPNSRSIPPHRKFWHIWTHSYGLCVCVCVYKAATFLVGLPCMVSLPLCLHRACPCSTLADTHWVQIQTQHTQIRKWVGVRRYVMTKIEELEGGDCVVFVQTSPPPHSGLSVPITAYQTFWEDLSELLTRGFGTLWK